MPIPTRVLHLVSSWEHVGALRRVGTLASHLKRDECPFRVVALSARGPDPRFLVPGEIPCKALAAGPRMAITLAWPLRRLAADWGADVVHAWDRAAARLAKRALVGQSKARVIAPANLTEMPAIDVERIRREADNGPTRKRIVSDLGLPAQARLLGFCGRLTGEKRLAELLWALDQIRCVRDDVYLAVVGDGEARALFERYARLYEIAERVRFVGWQNNAAAWIAALDVFCTASSGSSSSLALLEAMALGVPVVASDTAAHRRVVSPDETGLLVDVHQRSDWARRCLQALEDAELSSRISQAGQRQIVERFPVGPFIEGHRGLYRRVI